VVALVFCITFCWISLNESKSAVLADLWIYAMNTETIGQHSTFKMDTVNIS